MEAFWRDSVELVDRGCDHINDLNYPALSLNHRTFRKHAYLHLKIDLTKDIWETKIVSPHKENLNILDS